MASNFTLSQNLNSSNGLMVPTVLYTLPAVYLCYTSSRKVCLMRSGWMREGCVAVLCYLVKTLHFLVNFANLMVIWIIFVLLLNKVFLQPDTNYRMDNTNFVLDQQIFRLLRTVFLYTIAFVPSIIIYEWKFRNSRLQRTRVSRSNYVPITELGNSHEILDVHRGNIVEDLSLHSEYYSSIRGQKKQCLRKRNGTVTHVRPNRRNWEFVDSNENDLLVLRNSLSAESIPMFRTVQYFNSI
ncbi:uncharacterized protein LOC119073107 [Bradysia coprophila]|uniref:uncharacterized protein LOC119073107 n=1 Tax=Bradysia coprophila TaxID=38358 RepID=UPI00187DD4DB|nr:uncharacterized protein LOC119073107 [Bradysia coprophila]